MLAAASYFEWATNLPPGHDWFLYTTSLPLFYLLFSLHSINYRRWYLAGNHSDARPFLLLHPIRTSNKSDAGPCLLLHPILNGATLAAASFCKRTDPSRALIVCRNDGIPLCCCCYRIHCQLSLTRTLAAASYHERSIGRGSRLLLHSFEHDGYLNFNNQT